MQDARTDAWLSIVALAIVLGVAVVTFTGATRLLPLAVNQRAAQSSTAELEQYLPRLPYAEKGCLPVPSSATATASPAASPICLMP